MIKRVERASKRTEIRIEGVTCDRCGKELRRVTGVGVDYQFPFRGIAISGNLYAKSGNAAETRRLDAEICEDCTEALIDWLVQPSARGTDGSDCRDDLIDREFTYERLEIGC